MAKAVELKESMSADQFRAEAAKTKDPNQTRRLLALDAIRDGKSQASGSKPAAWIPQTPRDGVHAFNNHGVDKLINKTPPSRQ